MAAGHAQIQKPHAAADARLEWSSFEPVHTGMPQLCRAGLSENWLLKACGHRHWMALALAHGLDVPDFRDSDNQRLYPAFVSVGVEAHGDGFGSIGENVLIDFRLVLERETRTRFVSQMEITADGSPIATVRTSSVFVNRSIAGVNRSARRGIVARPCSLLPSPRPQTTPFRADSWETVLGFNRADRLELAQLVLDPSPHEDFNGAEFLYCTAFQAMIDRAEWQWFRQASPLLVTRTRQIFYLGNAELGDRIIMTLCGTRKSDEGRDHWVEMQRESDGKLIALAFVSRLLNKG